METNALRELVKKIFGDEDTKAQFMENPDSVLSQFALTEQEKKAVLSTYFKVGLVTGTSPQLDAIIEPFGLWI
jgi:hypothetical protein